jgi:hypothetical protein
LALFKVVHVDILGAGWWQAMGLVDRCSLRHKQSRMLLSLLICLLLPTAESLQVSWHPCSSRISWRLRRMGLTHQLRRTLQRTTCHLCLQRFCPCCLPTHLCVGGPPVLTCLPLGGQRSLDIALVVSTDGWAWVPRVDRAQSRTQMCP